MILKNDVQHVQQQQQTQWNGNGHTGTTFYRPQSRLQIIARDRSFPAEITQTRQQLQAMVRGNNIVQRTGNKNKNKKPTRQQEKKKRQPATWCCCQFPILNLEGDVDIANKIWPGHVMSPATVKTSQWQKYHIIHNFIAEPRWGKKGWGHWELSCCSLPRKSLASSVECLLK